MLVDILRPKAIHGIRSEPRAGDAPGANAEKWVGPERILVNPDLFHLISILGRHTHIPRRREGSLQITDYNRLQCPVHESPFAGIHLPLFHVGVWCINWWMLTRPRAILISIGLSTIRLTSEAEDWHNEPGWPGEKREATSNRIP